MNKFIILIILVLIPACMPASKVALQRTNSNVHALAVEHENLVDVVCTGLSLPENTKQALKGNANKIVITTEQETKVNVGIFNFDSFFGGVVSILEKVEPFLKVAGSMLGGEAGSTIIATGLTAITAYLAHRRTVKGVVKGHEEEKKESSKKALIKQHTMAKIKPESQIEFDKCREEAIKELKARGEI